MQSSISDFLKNKDQLLKDYKKELDQVKDQVKNAVFQEIEKSINSIFLEILQEFENRVGLIQEEVSEPSLEKSLDEVFKSLCSNSDLDMKSKTDKLINSMGFAESSSEMSSGSINNIVQMIVTLKEQKTDANFNSVAKNAREHISSSLGTMLSKSLLPKIAKLNMNRNNKSIEISATNTSGSKECSSRLLENRSFNKSDSKYQHPNSNHKADVTTPMVYQKKMIGSKITLI